MGMTLNQMRAAVKTQRAEIAALRNTLKAHIAGLKTLRADIKSEVSINRVVKEDARRLVREQREAKKAERIAKLEAKILAMKSPKATRKANKKASEVRVYSPEEIAALNVARA
jgi:hypothetical protein